MARTVIMLPVSMLLLAGPSFGGDTASLPPLKAEIVDCATVTPVAEVALIDYGFEPSTVKIPVGSTVRWTNKGDTSHIVKSGAPEEADAGIFFDTSFITVRNSRCIRFTTPGTYSYFCRIHSRIMKDGKISVE